MNPNHSLSMTIHDLGPPQHTEEIVDRDEEAIHSTISDDEESIADDDSYTASELLHPSVQDEITSSLAASGTIPGLAAAAAVVTAKKRQRPYKFEINPTARKRHHTRLIRKLKQTMHEFCTRCGQQAVIVCVNPGKENSSFRVLGASPLDQVVRSCSSIILRDLERVLQEQAPNHNENNQGYLSFELPQLVIDGIPTPVDKMNQAQLRMFIPEMLKYSTGRGKPGWGKESTKPKWWPLDVPWANVRRDARSEDQKLRVSWTQALRQIVKNCYKYHGRDDLLNFFPSEHQNNRVSLGDRFTSATLNRIQSIPPNLNPPTLVQTLQNSDGSVSLVQLDSGQTIATITQDQTGAAIATLTGQDNSEGPLAVTMHQVANGQWGLGTSDLHSNIATVSETSSADDSSMNQVSNAQHMTGVLLKKSPTNSTSTQQQNTHTIGITFDNGQAFATIQNNQVQNSGQIMLTSEVSQGEDANSAAMVQIPVSVYEKIANTIQQCGGNGSTNSGINEETIQISETDVLTSTVQSHHMSQQNDQQTPSINMSIS